MLKRAQALPLNTIVIAILVIIVLLVIIVFFTTKVGDSGQTLNEQSASQCTLENAAIGALADPSIKPYGKSTGESCNDGDRSIPGVKGPNNADICCYKPK